MNDQEKEGSSTEMSEQEKEERLSTDSSYSDCDEIKEEKSEESPFRSLQDGFKIKKKLVALIRRIKRSRKLSASEHEPKSSEDSRYTLIKSEEDKVSPVRLSNPSYNQLDDKCTYRISKHRPGLAVFIINSEFQHQPYRPFATVDQQFMTKLFKHLGFEIKLLENKTGFELWKNLLEIQRSITTDYDCFVCIISSHGAEVPLSRLLDPDRKLRQHVIFTRDGEIPTDKILEVFSDDRCENLKGKPRMFFIQACRCAMGADENFDVDKGIDIELSHTYVNDEEYPIVHFKKQNKTRSDGTKESNNFPNDSSLKERVHFSTPNSSELKERSQADTHGIPEDRKNPRYELFRFKEPAAFCFIPCYEDFLVMFSSASEKTAWSDRGKGGWLIYCLYKVFKRLVNSSYKSDLLHILCEVCGKMARELHAELPSDSLRHETKSTATIYHMLTKDIYLIPKHVTIIHPVIESSV